MIKTYQQLDQDQFWRRLRHPRFFSAITRSNFGSETGQERRLAFRYNEIPRVTI